MDHGLERIGDLDTWNVRRTACVRRLASLDSAEALTQLEALFIAARREDPAATRTVLAISMWMARSDMPAIRSEGRTLRPRRDPVLERLRSDVSRDATPLAFHVLTQPGVEPTSRAWWASGMAVEVPRMLRKPGLNQPWAPWSAFHFGGDSASRRMSSLLDTPALNPVFVIRLASVRRLPSELAYAIAIRDRWIARPDVREALILSRTVPAALAGALLPTSTGRVLRLVAQRHPSESVRAGAEEFLARSATEGDA
ncbi:MAG: hypothetical protein HOV80_38750 [Polyangiaceae bacterium]|nr:hypothetical protein [Polyangiaceae bacterium]